MVRPIQLMIVGAQKAGTTSLQRYLGEHPYIFTHRQEEMTFFVREEEYNHGYDKIFNFYFDGYNEKYKVLLAKSVGIMYWPEAAKRLKNHNPDIHLVAILRNPVERAYSAYWYCRRMGWEKLKSFEDAIKAEPKRLKEKGVERQHCTYIDRGIYHGQISFLFELFGRDRVHVFLFENFKKDLLNICRTIFKLYDLDYNFIPNIDHYYNKAATVRSEKMSQFISLPNHVKRLIKVFIPGRIAFYIKEKIRKLNEKEITIPPMNPETKKWLIEYFKGHNEELGKLIGKDLRQWNQV